MLSLPGRKTYTRGWAGFPGMGWIPGGGRGSWGWTGFSGMDDIPVDGLDSRNGLDSRGWTGFPEWTGFLEMNCIPGMDTHGRVNEGLTTAWSGHLASEFGVLRSFSNADPFWSWLDLYAIADVEARTERWAASSRGITALSSRSSGPHDRERRRVRRPPRPMIPWFHRSRRCEIGDWRRRRRGR